MQNIHSSTTQEAAALKAREWLAILIVIIAVAALTAVTQFKNNVPSSSVYLEKEGYSTLSTEVIVKGAVELPGTYHIGSEMTLGALLELAKVYPTADLSKLRLDSVIRKSRMVVVKEKEQITVYLTGAVKKSGALKVAKGTTLEQLLKSTELDDQAHVEAINGKRKLKENELIEIPFRKVL